MHLSVSFENTEGTTAGSGPVQVGWFLNIKKAGVVYFPPERVRSADMNKKHAKSASRCPAVINLESRYFMIRCPFDLNLEFVRDKEGRPALRNLNGDMSGIRAGKLRDKLHVTAEHEWRYPGIPTVQLELPYVFIADEPVYINQVAPFMHYQKTPFPGTIFGGRFPINVWPRPLMWAFEWHDTTKALKVNRGDPLFYAQFEVMPQDRSVVVSEVEVTDELNDYMEHISGAVNYVNQTFSLFEAAEKARPERLVVPVKRIRSE
ncbi:hypothetical protein SAMN04488515_2831 [Cognatiyoonia koreensis]|uniref:Uncharacterized protein n=1 Tax=Cognatiyoonia koreensis TaxID=364200 RepID=A0A1I0RLZ5_9RHOB|nr:hypothetical protein [Cognatiyoonia koreensis]SEW41455.1 hypothetical protein SAMN04488515_2831 [Cognatiyoonia koreensis]